MPAKVKVAGGGIHEGGFVGDVAATVGGNRGGATVVEGARVVIRYVVGVDDAVAQCASVRSAAQATDSTLMG